MKKIVLVCLLMVASMAIQAQKSVLLRLNYKKGDKFVQKINATQKIEVMGMNMPQSTTFELDNEVLEVMPNGNFKVKMIYSRVAIKQENPMQGTVEYDSDKEENEDNMLKGMFENIVGKKVVVIMDNKGEFVDVVESDMDNGKETLKKVLNDASVAYPENKVKVGDTWTNTAKMEAQNLKIENTYTLSKIEGGNAIVAISSKVYNAKDNSDAGKQSGTMTLEIKTGMVLKMEVEQDMQVTAQGMSMQIKGKNLFVTEKK